MEPPVPVRSSVLSTIFSSEIGAVDIVLIERFACYMQQEASGNFKEQDKPGGGSEVLFDSCSLLNFSEDLIAALQLLIELKFWRYFKAFVKKRGCVPHPEFSASDKIR